MISIYYILIVNIIKGNFIIIDLVVTVNLSGRHTCLVLPLTHVMVLVIPVHQLQ